MPHIIQQNLAAEIELILSLKFPTTQNFQMPTVINCLNIMLLLFTIFRYLPNFIFSRNTAHLMISQKNNVIWAVSTISPTGYNIIWYASDLKVVLVVIVLAMLEHFTFFLIELTDLDNSAILIFFEYFSKDSYMFKNVVSKNKANYKLMLLVHKEKNYHEIIKINITKVFI